jgi:adenosine deaminase
MNQNPSDEFDVVIDALSERIKQLQRLDKNTDNGIMTTIRFEQIDNLEKAMDSWRKYKWNINGTKDF